MTPETLRPFSPRYVSKTDRRKYRRNVRAALGTSRDEAPGVLAALDAATWLDLLLREASGGRLRLRVSIDGNVETASPDNAYRMVREINQARREA